MKFKVGDRIYHTEIASHLIFTIQEITEEYYHGFRSDTPEISDHYKIWWIDKNFRKLTPLEELL